MAGRASIAVTVTTGGLSGRRFEFDADRITIGRRVSCDVALPASDTKASSRHCELFRQGSRWYLRDLGSTNGTLIGKKPIGKPVEVETGTMFELGPGGPVMLLQLMGGPLSSRPAEPPDDPTGAMPVVSPSADTEAPPEPVSDQAPAPGSSPEQPADPAAVHGPSTGRTAYYMALMTDKVKRSSGRLKWAIAVLSLLVIGLATFAVIMATRTQSLEAKVEASQDERRALEDKLDETRSALGDARTNLASTSAKLGELRVQIRKAEGDARDKLQAQARELEASRKKYEAQLKKQEDELARLKDSGRAAETIARKYEKSLFMLIAPTPKGEFGFCTAFAIDPKGVLATNAHCVGMLRELAESKLKAVARMNRVPGVTYEVAGWKAHPRHSALFSQDVAIVRLDLPPGTTLPVAAPLASDEKVRTKLSPGQPIYTMGFPGKVMNEARPAADFRAAVISRLTDFANAPGTEESARMVWHSALTSKGTSGSPIFDADGEVIAVNTGGLTARKMASKDPLTGQDRDEIVYDATGLNFGIRIDTLRELLP